MISLPEGEGTKRECRKKLFLCLFLLEGKGLLFGTGYEEVESGVGYVEGTTTCWAADWGEKRACGPNTKSVCIAVWKHETKIVVDCLVV